MTKKDGERVRKILEAIQEADYLDVRWTDAAPKLERLLGRVDAALKKIKF